MTNSQGSSSTTRDSTTTKPWGQETLVELNDAYAVKLITIEPGQRTSLHVHARKRETLYVVSGVLELEVNGVAMGFDRGHAVTIPAGATHRMSNPRKNAVVKYVECSTPELDDLRRLEDDHGRA